ncbi:TatD family hydrolase [Patescibacteria group bacterium]|nr:TatD family hydrolase [Patescibacteria group bacterium]
MNFIDSHCHLDSPKFHADLEQTVERAFSAGAVALINIGVDLATSKSSVGLASRYRLIYASIGVHPHDAKTLSNDVIEKMRRLGREQKVVAVGEIGLDYYRNLSNQAIQRQAFIEQLNLAKELNKPIIVHCREAYSDVLDILDEQYLPHVSGKPPGVIHSFSVGVRYAQEFLKRGFYLGINGMVTYPNNTQLVEAVKIIPMDKILIETDAPLLAPLIHRGKRNEPLYVLEVAQQIAKIKNLSVEEVCQTSTNNTRQLFNLQ